MCGQTTECTSPVSPCHLSAGRKPRVGGVSGTHRAPCPCPGLCCDRLEVDRDDRGLNFLNGK